MKGLEFVITQGELIGFKFGTEWTCARIMTETDKAMSFSFVYENCESKKLWIPKKAITWSIENKTKTITISGWFLKADNDTNWRDLYFTLKQLEKLVKGY